MLGLAGLATLVGATDAGGGGTEHTPVGLEVFEFERVLASFAALMLLAPALLLARPLPADKVRSQHMLASLPGTSAALLTAQLAFWAVSFLHYRLRLELTVIPAVMVLAPRVLIFFGCCVTALCWAPARSIELPMRQCGLAALSSVTSAWFLAHGHDQSSPAARRVADLLIPCSTVLFLAVLRFRGHDLWAGADSGPTLAPPPVEQDDEPAASEQALLDDDSGDADAAPWDGQSTATERDETPKAPAKDPAGLSPPGRILQDWKRDMYEAKPARAESVCWTGLEAGALCASGLAVALPAAAATSTGVLCLTVHAVLEASTAVLQGACFKSRDGVRASSRMDLLAVLGAQSGVSLCLSAAVPPHEVALLATQGWLLLAYAFAGCLAVASSVELVRRVGPAEACLLLAMARWPLPLGQLGLFAAVLGPGLVLVARGLRTH